MVNVIIYIAIFLFQLIIKSIGDWYYKTKQKKIINHALSSVIDVVIYTISAYILFYKKFNLFVIIGIVLTSLASRWILYDLIYNKINHHKWNHYGYSSWLDRRMRTTGKWHIIIKLIILGFCLNFIVWS